MSDKAFFDTNLLVYAFDGGSPEKQATAKRLIGDYGSNGYLVLSTQVLQEFYVVTTQKSKGITAKGRCTIHDDDATKEWFYPALAERIIGQPGKLADAFVSMLDSERRLVIEIAPEKWITFDAAKMMVDSMKAWKESGLL